MKELIAEIIEDKFAETINLSSMTEIIDEESILSER